MARGKLRGSGMDIWLDSMDKEVSNLVLLR